MAMQVKVGLYQSPTYILSILMGDNVLSNTVLLCSTHHTNVLLLLEIVAPIFIGSPSWLKL